MSPAEKSSRVLAWPGGAPGAVLRGALSLLAGLAVALMFHYLLYRVELPSKPFIYVAF
jgi:hypothetical protein